MRYGLVEAHRGGRPVRLMCRVLRAPAGGYHDRRGRPRGRRAARRDASAVATKAVHAEAKARHGGPRIRAELVARGMPCRVNTVPGLMHGGGIAAKAERGFRCTTDPNHGRPVAETVLDRHLEPAAPDRTWTADITPIPTAGGWLDPAAVEGLYPRKIVGWSMGSRIGSRPVADALETAISRRLPGEGLVAHPDRGSRYASEHHRGTSAGRGIVCGMSRRAGRRDNAPMESSFASPKEGLTHGEVYATRGEARASTFEHIEVFFDRVRRPSSLGYESPAE